MKHLRALVLATNKSNKMNSKRSNYIHKIYGKPVIGWVIHSLAKAEINTFALIVEENEEDVPACLGESVPYVSKQSGETMAYTFAKAIESFEDTGEEILVVSGDMPLISAQTCTRLWDYHKEQRNVATRMKSNGSEVCCFTIRNLMEVIKENGDLFSNDEYVLPELQEQLGKRGGKVETIEAQDSMEMLCVEDRVQLAQASSVIQRRILEEHMRAGVTIMDPHSTHIDEGVEIGMDTQLYPGTILEGNTKVGEDCVIGPNSRLVNIRLGNRVEVNNSVGFDSSIGDDTHVGPFAYIRPGSVIGKDVKIGDFVEIKKSVIGDKTKISHLTYVGDAEVGRNVNLGCGVVFVNYDGKNKNKTVVEDNVFVGCNTNLVSPVVVKESAYIAAGSTITEEVPENSLAIARSRQVIKEDWVIKKGMKRKG